MVCLPVQKCSGLLLFISMKVTSLTQAGRPESHVGGSTRVSTILPKVSKAQSVAPVTPLTTSVHRERWCTVAVTVRRSLDRVLGTARHADSCGS